MSIKMVYFTVYLLIVLIVYGIGSFIENSFQNKKIVQLVIMFTLAIIADRFIKKLMNAGDKHE